MNLWISWGGVIFGLILFPTNVLAQDNPTSKEARIQAVVKGYRFWRTQYNHPKYDSENTPFLEFISNNLSVVRHSITYEEYLEVGRFLQKDYQNLTPTALDRISFELAREAMIGLQGARNEHEKRERGLREEKNREKVANSKKRDADEIIARALIEALLRKAENEKNAIPDVDEKSIPKNPRLAFLIEGNGISNTLFPEVKRAENLAKARGGAIFDSIHSYDNKHHIAMILGRTGKSLPLSDREKKLYAIQVIVDFHEIGTPKGIIEKQIRSPYLEMKEKGLIKEVPAWVSSLSEKNYDNFVKQAASDQFGGLSGETYPIEKG